MISNTASESQPEKHNHVCICPHLKVNPHSLPTTWFNLFQDNSLKPLNELSPLWCFCRSICGLQDAETVDKGQKEKELSKEVKRVSKNFFC